MYLSSKRSFQQFSYPLLADVFYIWFSFRLFSSICTIIARFTPIFQCIMQHHCTVLSVQNRFFSTMLRQYGLLSRHSWEQLLQQSPHPSMQPLRPALRSSSVLSLQDISQYNHLELEIYDCYSSLFVKLCVPLSELP